MVESSGLAGRMDASIHTKEDCQYHPVGYPYHELVQLWSGGKHPE